MLKERGKYRYDDSQSDIRDEEIPIFCYVFSEQAIVVL